MRQRAGGRERGQATVELALALPVVALLVLALVQLGVLALRQVQVVHAAREGARIAAVDASLPAVEAAVRGSGTLDPTRLSVVLRPSGDTVTVEVRYTDPTDVPLIGPLLGPVVFTESATMRAE